MTAERDLAHRINEERVARGWSYETLAAVMSEAGCPINGSAIYRIEKGDPPRRITVNELAAFSAIWAIPIEKLLTGCGAHSYEEFREQIRADLAADES